MRVLLVLLLVGCWREPARRSEPELSFVARVNVLTELRQRVDALGPELEVTMQRILGLASEAERAAIADDLAALELEIARLSRIARDARGRGDNPELLADVERKLGYATRGLANLREDLLHARTQAEQEAFEELKKKVEGTLDDEVRIRIYRRNDALPPMLQPVPPRLPPTP